MNILYSNSSSMKIFFSVMIYIVTAFTNKVSLLKLLQIKQFTAFLIEFIGEKVLHYMRTYKLFSIIILVYLFILERSNLENY